MNIVDNHKTSWNRIYFINNILKILTMNILFKIKIANKFIIKISLVLTCKISIKIIKFFKLLHQIKMIHNLNLFNFILSYQMMLIITYMIYNHKIVLWMYKHNISNYKYMEIIKYVLKILINIYSKELFGLTL